MGALPRAGEDERFLSDRPPVCTSLEKCRFLCALIREALNAGVEQIPSGVFCIPGPELPPMARASCVLCVAPFPAVQRLKRDEVLGRQSPALEALLGLWPQGFPDVFFPWLGSFRSRAPVFHASVGFCAGRARAELLLPPGPCVRGLWALGPQSDSSVVRAQFCSSPSWTESLFHCQFHTWSLTCSSIKCATAELHSQPCNRFLKQDLTELLRLASNFW